MILAMATPHADGATLKAIEHKGSFAYCPKCKGIVKSVCWSYEWKWIHWCGAERPKVTKG